MTKEYYQTHREEIIGKARRYRIENRELIAQRKRLAQEANPQKRKEESKRHYLKHRDKIIARERAARVSQESKDYRCVKSEEYYQKNKAAIIAQHKGYLRNRRKTDPQFRLRMNISCRVQAALRRCLVNKGGKCAEQFIGCDIKNLAIYLESLFEPGMTWENYGSVWHVDHIIPCSLFDLTKPDHQAACFHFSNLRPMIASENLKKSNKLPEGIELPVILQPGGGF